MTHDTTSSCGCCAGTAVATPRAVHNRPGLAAIAYRVGDHGRFRQTLLARLAAYPALQGLGTRDPDDFTLALLDAWAALGDNLTFYQERIANEHYLPTAIERRSVLALATLVGYRPSPGVAASVWLAFTQETAPMPGAAPMTTLQAGLKAQSIPGPGETAQVFETIEAIPARPEWNAMRPRLTQFQNFAHETPTLLIDGLTTGLRAGDGLILTTDDAVSRLSLVTAVETDPARQFTRVHLQPVPAPSAGLSTGSEAGGTLTTRARAAVGAGNSSLMATSASGVSFGGALNGLYTGQNLYALSYLQGFSIANLFAHLKASAPPPRGVLALRTRAGIFGHQAPRWDALPVNLRSGEYGPDPNHTGNDDPSWQFIPGPYRNRGNTWVDSNTLATYPDPRNDDPTPADRIYLDGHYAQIAKDSFIAIKSGNSALVYQVDRVDEVSKTDFTLAAKVSRLILRFPTTSNTGLQHFPVRASTVYAHNESLTLARLPIDTPVGGEVIELDGWIEGLYAGQKLIVRGEDAEFAGVRQSEPAVIDRVDYLTDQEGFTRVTLFNALQHSYVRTSVIIHGNVALATHGETISEILGSGDPRRPWQHFELRQGPLTYVASANPDDAGARSTLELRVDGVTWREIPHFYGAAPEARGFVTHQDDDARTTIAFGDGRTGARPPSGVTNIRARYRKGLGSGGNVRAEQISLLLTRPLGVKDVLNPLPASGGADPESLADARDNVPLSVRTLGRVISLADYADFARAFAGIAKAHAAWVWNGQRRVVALTVAGDGGAAVDPNGPLHANLLAALAAAGDPAISVTLLSYRPGLARINARLKLDPDHAAETVLAAADASLRQRLSFTARTLGQPVVASAVVAWLQSVPGVLAVDLDALYRVVVTNPATGAIEPASLQQRVTAALPQAGGDGLLAAELLTLDPGGLVLGVLT